MYMDTHRDTQSWTLKFFPLMVTDKSCRQGSAMAQELDFRSEKNKRGSRGWRRRWHGG